MNGADGGGLRLEGCVVDVAATSDDGGLVLEGGVISGTGAHAQIDFPDLLVPSNDGSLHGTQWSTPQHIKNLRSIGLAGSSGHTTGRRARFAFGAFGPYTAALVILFAKEMYVLKLGANAERLSLITAVWSMTFPLMYPVAGALMDREPSLLAFARCGRRAPWFLIHILPLALIVAVVYLPGLLWTPGSGSLMLDVWLAVNLTLSAWCVTVLLNAWESARAEIYPFKDERVLVSGLEKIVGALAFGAAFLPQMLLWVVASLPVRFAVSVFLLVCISCSLEVVPVLKDAQQPRRIESSKWNESFELLRHRPMLHATALRFWHSAADMSVLTFGVYYLTFVDELGSYYRTQWTVICAAIVGALELLVLTPMWCVAWTKHPENPWMLGDFLRRHIPCMRVTCCFLQMLGAVVCPLLLRGLPIVCPGIEPWEWVASTVFLRVCFSPQTFFRTNSFCWAVDDDCHASGGRRREAMHAGVVKLFEEEGRAVAFALFIGLGQAGLSTQNCELLCDSAGDRETCVEDCDMEVVSSQPSLVAPYILFVLTFVGPAFGLVCAFHIWRFPIHGQRLQQLEERQASLFMVGVSSDRTEHELPSTAEDGEKESEI